MKEILNIHNSNPLCADQICALLDSLGYNAKSETRISRTLIFSDAPKSVLNRIIDLIFHVKEFDECGICGNAIFFKRGDNTGGGDNTLCQDCAGIINSEEGA